MGQLASIRHKCDTSPLVASTCYISRRNDADDDPKLRTRPLPNSMAHSPLTTSPGVRTPRIQRSTDVSHSHLVNFFSNCRLSKYIEIQFSPTSLTHPKASHPHPTGNATSHDHTRPAVVSPAVPRPPEGLTHSGLEREFVSSFSSDISDLCSAEHSPTSEHQQWPGVLAGDGGSGGHFPPSSGQPPIYNNMASSGRRRKSCTRFCTRQTGLTGH
jgi:hypothetical protein